MTIFEQVDTFVTEHNLIPDNSTVVLGLSGGPDSVFLLHYLLWAQKTKPFSIIAAHLDHQWREDSAADARFCQHLAHEYAIPFVLKRADELVLDTKPQSKEEAGRLLRRAFLEEVLETHNADRIALAHHKDDQHETFFIRLIRGAGITGLSGIRAKQGMYIHPLLSISKADILSYLRENQLDYREDPTNIHPEFLRNCIRHKGLPALASCDERIYASLDRTMHQLHEIDDFLEQYTAEQCAARSKKQDGAIWLDSGFLLEQHTYMQKRLIVHLLITAGVPFTPSQPFLEEIVRFIQQKKSRSHQLGPQWRMIKKDGYISIQSTN